MAPVGIAVSSLRADLSLSNRPVCENFSYTAGEHMPARIRSRRSLFAFAKISFHSFECLLRRLANGCVLLKKTNSPAESDEIQAFAA
jgi:hypothetical protein